ncbi:MAG: STAS domain-containing protein [Candidatus Eisenbacteria bacterium]
MDLQFEEHDGICVARTSEFELGADCADELRSALLGKMEENPWCCLDLSTITFMDSSALGVLVACLKAARGKGGFHLFGVQPRIDELFRLTGLRRVFACHEDEATCLASMRAARERAA